MTKKSKKNTTYTKIVGFFLFLTTIAIFTVMHFALAKVTIKIYGKVDTKTKDILVEMESENTLDKKEDGILGKIIKTEFDLETHVTSNKETVMGEKAGGYVTIYNKYSQNQILVATTRLLTPDNKLYRITERVNIPSGGQVEIWAEADQNGKEYNIPATSFIIPGLWKGLQDKIYAESKDGMNMQGTPKYLVTQESINQAQKNIKQEAEEKALETINEKLSKNLKINTKKLFLKFETLESSNLNEESETTILKQHVTAYGVVFSQESLEKMAKEKFTKELPDNQSLIKFFDNKFSYEIIDINPEKETSVLSVSLQADINSKEGTWDIDKNKIIGLTKHDIEQYLKELKIEKFEISFFPAWVNKAPDLKDHIIIE